MVSLEISQATGTLFSGCKKFYWLTQYFLIKFLKKTCDSLSCFVKNVAKCNSVFSSPQFSLSLIGVIIASFFKKLASSKCEVLLANWVATYTFENFVPYSILMNW